MDTATVLTVFGPLAFGGIHVLQTALYVALRHETELADLDREWLGRVNALILRIAVLWTVFSLACVVLPVAGNLLAQQHQPPSVSVAGGNTRAVSADGPKQDAIESASPSGVSLVSVIAAVLGGLSAWFGKIWPSLQQLGEKPGVWDRLRAYLPAILGVLFAIALLALLGGLVQFGLGKAQLAVLGWPKTVQQLQERSGLLLPLQLQAGAVVLLLLMLAAFRPVNVNRFSMHAVYRNRLSRAFLGSARSQRRPEPFTGFDPDDNPPLTALRRNAASLFPVINMTLNMTAGSNAAWAERQAASFVATPLSCGSAALCHPQQTDKQAEPLGAFVATTNFAGLETLDRRWRRVPETGPALGSMLTVSGAAVSPSWGYHTSRITAFMMTLFNVRLGMWLPNPSRATQSELRLARPRHAVQALLSEMLGQTTSDSQAIYLSDGGHFENLGLYEMLRRRCETIVVVDAGQDEACSLFDLGGAIRKAEIDLGLQVTMQSPLRLYSRSRLETERTLGADALDFAVGRIGYSGGQSGRLLYIKPSYLEGSPVPVRSYGEEHKTFPHESTADQWFSESQFESYRTLGCNQVMRLLRQVEEADLAGLLSAAEQAASAASRNGAASRCVCGATISG